jgi:alkanesulfonate monooxygenase SsuD/methylene tetrahydromethanopterin reductase-like flavin-dependent oxidoreductase (luciferase family)
MDVGLLAIFQNYLGRGNDDQVVADELALAELAEELGYDKFWVAEHHFTDYSACPDNVQYLSWLAGRTSRIRLCTGAVIVPWNSPVRVAEKMAFLDYLSGGRAVLGLGRGLARREYESFGIDMGESRDRFDEAARMIIDALDTGFIEGNGPYYPQKRTEIRPRPVAGFRDRLYCVGMSPESVEQAALLGARLMIFSQQPWEMFAEGSWASFCKTWASAHEGAPPPPLTGDLMYCHADADVAKQKGREYMANYFLTIVNHYEIMSEHFKDVKGYDYYGTAGDLFREVGLETAVETYCDVQSYGTPEQLLEKFRSRRQLLGEFELSMIVHYGGMPFDETKASVELFSREVLPELQKW